MWKVAFLIGHTQVSAMLTRRSCHDGIIPKWYKSDLNKEQRAAVQSILIGAHHPAPYIVFGPPGTGKTSVLVEAAMQVSSLSGYLLKQVLKRATNV